MAEDEKLKLKQIELRPMKLILKDITSIITELNTFPRDETKRLPDEIILAIGKLNGAIAKLTAYKEVLT